MFRRRHRSSSALAAAALCAGLMTACAEPDSGPSADSQPGAAPSDAAQDADYATPTPEPNRDPATRAPTADLPDDYLRHPWAAKGVDADCAKPNFDITRNSAGGLVVETRLNGAPRDGYVRRAGPGGSEAAFIFDQTELPIVRRGLDGLAVMPPDSGEAVMLAGHRLTGDGVVFIQCPRA